MLAEILKRFATIRSLPVAAWVAIAGSTLLLLVSALQWSLIDLLTPFLFLPLHGFVWLIFVGTCMWSLSYLVQTGIRRRAFLPITICAVCLGLVIFFPFTQLWLGFNFAINRTAREQVVRDILEHRLMSNVSYNEALISLPNRAPHLSAGGNEVVTEQHAGKTYVLFFAFRGLLGNFAGFLYVPTGGDPTMFKGLNEPRRTTVERYDDHWFFVSHH